MHRIGNNIQLGIEISDNNEKIKLSDASASATSEKHSISLNLTKNMPVYIQKKAKETFGDTLSRTLKNAITWIRSGKNQTIEQKRKIIWTNVKNQKAQDLGRRVMNNVYNLKTSEKNIQENESKISQQKTLAQRFRHTSDNEILRLETKLTSLERKKYDIQNSFSSRIEHAMNVRSKITQQIKDNDKNIMRLKNTPSQNSITKAINKKQNEKYKKLKEAQSKNQLAVKELETTNISLKSKLTSLNKFHQMITRHSNLSEQVKETNKQYTQQYKSSAGNPSEYYLLQNVFTVRDMEDIQKWSEVTGNDLETEYDDTLTKANEETLTTNGYITLNNNRVTLTEKGQNLFVQAFKQIVYAQQKRETRSQIAKLESDLNSLDNQLKKALGINRAIDRKNNQIETIEGKIKQTRRMQRNQNRINESTIWDLEIKKKYNNRIDMKKSKDRITSTSELYKNFIIGKPL
ncbi:hypothetical protein N9N03_01850 [Chlamydiia bacterium]|nr:hypothetical protein [Chlamydiia bacterium]